MTSDHQADVSGSLAYVTIGEKTNPPVLLIHGFTGSGDDWRELAADLSSDYFVVLIDLPGHGRTRINDPKFFTMGYTASLLVKLLDSLGIDRSHLVGYSMGGRLGIFLLTEFPDRFLRAVLESTSAGLESEEDRAARRRRDETLAASLTDGSLRLFLDEWYRQPLFATMHRWRDRMAELTERRQNNDPRGLATSLRMMGTGVQPNLWPRLPNITHPVLFIAGENDDKFVDTARRMADLCPAGKVCTIADSGHNTHFEQPVAFREAVRSFLERNE
jgi:2-succinyl-6-hydroxy-2,4-cyclohexadiene-1-carboxylate synthase